LPETTELVEVIVNLWEGRYLILGSLAFFLLMGAYNVWTTVPVYQIDAMVQVQAKRTGSMDTSLSKMESLFSEPSEAQTEIEILKSNRVLGGTVEALGLDTFATPKLLPVVGAALVKDKPDAPRIEVEAFEVPEALRGEKFRLTALSDGGFQWQTSRGTVLATGRPGEWVYGATGGLSMRLKVRILAGKAGQKYVLMKKPLNMAITELNQNFTAAEKGKQTNVLGLSLKNTVPAKGALILNEIINQYVQHKASKKAGETSKTLALLQAKMPVLKANLDASENRLNQFRARSGSVDLSREADTFIQQGASINGQISALKQKKEELLRTYKENADVVVTLNMQIAKLQGEQQQVDAKMRSLPGTQQEVVRLSRDVQVNTELYTALLNNIQQLQISSAGEMGNVAVIDPATPNLVPLNLRAWMVLTLHGFLGLVLGVGVLMLRRVLRTGVKDHRLIESRLGLTVLATIPHSKLQEEHDRAISRRQPGFHLLAMLNPDDLATESFLSLRTALHFSLQGARNSAVMITGPSPDIGKSFVTGNLAAVMAQTGAKVLVVDADLRRGNLHHYFGFKNRLGGLSEVLSGRADWKTLIQASGVPDLDVLSTGAVPPNPSDLLMSSRFSEFLEEAWEAYDFVLIDAPPLLPVTDALLIGAKVGSVLLVAKYDHNPLEEIQACQKRLEKQGIVAKGCIFNDIKPLGIGYGYYDYRYAYHYKYK
jgi:tyrosine-protein kinase Etk/Wzc